MPLTIPPSPFIPPPFLVQVATVAIGNAANAGLLAIRIMAAHDPALLAKMTGYQVR